MSQVPKEIMVFKLNFLSDCRLTMSQASSTLYSPATTCSKKWSKTLLTIQIIWNIGMNQESNLIKIPKAKFFSRPNVQPNFQPRPIVKKSASVIYPLPDYIEHCHESNLIRYLPKTFYIPYLLGVLRCQRIKVFKRKIV